MKHTRQALTLLLAASFTASLLSCGDSQPVTADTTAADSSTSTQDSTEPLNHREAEASSLPADLDFGGNKLTVLSRDDEQCMQEFLVEEETGDVVSDAIYARNLAVEEQLNIQLEVIGRKGDYANRDQFVNAVRADVMAGTTEYDVISYYAYSMPSLSQENLLLNLLELDYLDFNKPWWHQSFTENASVYGKLYMATGDINLTSVTSCTALFFNKRLAGEYLPDTDLYQTVLDGKWTIDCMASLVKDVYNDVNGNSTEELEDFHGWDANGALDAFPVGAGITYTKKTADGGYEWNFYTERNNDIITRFYDLCQEPGIYFVDKVVPEKFIEGNTIFFANTLNLTDQLRDMKDDYGILPMPKYDEKQESYYSSISDGYSEIAIPASCADPRMSAAFLELACEKSYKMVTPAYFEVAMKAKYLRDEESAQMFDLIIESAWYDFAVIHTAVSGNPVFVTRNAEQQRDGTFASQYAAKESILESSLAAILDNYKK